MLASPSAARVTAANDPARVIPAPVVLRGVRGGAAPPVIRWAPFGHPLRDDTHHAVILRVAQRNRRTTG